MSWFRAAPPRATHEVSVSEDHVLHVTEYGTPDGIPIVYLHGGPGGGTPPDARRLFDPERFRVVLFDQRGCGKSVCSDRLHGNTTDHLLADVEAVRAALGIECWAVMGSSYGSLLTALYAVRNPSRVRFALLHGVWTDVWQPAPDTLPQSTQPGEALAKHREVQVFASLCERRVCCQRLYK